jgi:sec-independent protein translocase protein TatB
MLDIAWPELMVIGIVAVVAIGPKDLPKVMNTLGRWVSKARLMAQDFQRSFDQLNFEAEAANRMQKEAGKPPEPATDVAPPQPAPPHDSPHDRTGVH